MNTNQKTLLKYAIKRNIHKIPNGNFIKYRLFILTCIKSRPDFDYEMIFNIYKGFGKGA